MSNGTNTPFGFKPIGNLTCAEVPLRAFRATSATAGALGRWDLVEQESAGNIERSAAGSVQILGSVDGFLYTDTNDNSLTKWSPYNAATQVATANVAYHPQNIYIAQGDVTASALAQEGAECDHIDAAPSSTTYQSQQYLDIANVDGAQTGFRLLKLHDIPSNAVGDTYSIYECLCVEHAWLGTTAI